MKTQISLRRIAFGLLIISIIIFVVNGARPQTINFLSSSLEEAQLKRDAILAIPNGIQAISIQGIIIGVVLYIIALLLEFRKYLKSRTKRCS